MKKNWLLILFSVLTSVTFTEGQSNSPYVFDQFVKGSVILISGDSVSKSMNYNAATEEMVYEQNGRMMALDQVEQIRSVVLGDIVFEPIKEKFYQKIGNWEEGLYISYKGKVLPPSSPSAYGSESNTTATTNWATLSSKALLYTLSLPSDYKIIKSREYFLRKSGVMLKANNASQLCKIYPEKQTELKAYIKANKIKFSNTDDFYTLIRFCVEGK
jgi:hypothetical protein